MLILLYLFFFFSSRRRHTRLQGDWSSDVCSSDLQGLRAGDQGAPSRAAPREPGDLARRNPADRAGPERVFPLTVAAAQQIGLERLPAYTESVEEGAVMQPLVNQGIGELQHQRD